MVSRWLADGTGGGRRLRSGRGLRERALGGRLAQLIFAGCALSVRAKSSAVRV